MGRKKRRPEISESPRPAERAGSEEQPAELSTARKRLFTAAMLSIPVLFFVLLEAGLRLGGFGDRVEAFITHPVTGPRYYQNPDLSNRYFSRTENAPTASADFFDVNKQPESFRVFVQGGSTAAGFPFYHGGSFSRILSERLSRSLPDGKVEVVNTSMAAVNSYTLLDLSRDILRHQPDAVLIYAGHNEYYGALGVASAERLGTGGLAARLYLRLRDVRIVQLLKNVVAWMYAPRGGDHTGLASDATLMERMVGEQSVPYGSRLHRAGIEQFRGNLRSLLNRYRAHDVPVFIATLASNERDHVPFKSGHGPDADVAAWRMHFDSGTAALDDGRWEEAVNAFSRAISADELHAEAYFHRARAYEKLGQVDAAREDYLSARDRDLLRFRAPAIFNRIIREEAARSGAFMVELEERFRAASPGGLIGKAFMLEHLHPNPAGYRLMAEVFYDALADQAGLLVPGRFRSVPASRYDFLLTDVDSLAGMYRVQQLMGRWPFQPPGTVSRWLDTLRLGSFLEELALKRVRREVNWLDGNRALGTYLERENRFDESYRVALAIRQQYPFNAGPYLAAGRVLMKAGRNDEALTYFVKSNEIEESADASKMAGTLLLNRGDVERAIPYLERAVHLWPADEQALYNLSGAYALTGDFERSRRTAQRLLEISPQNRQARELLASLPG